MFVRIVVSIPVHRRRPARSPIGMAGHLCPCNFRPASGYSFASIMENLLGIVFRHQNMKFRPQAH